MDTSKFAGPFIGQLIFLEKIEVAPHDARRALARVALNASGEGAQYPILLSEAMSISGWDEYQVFLGMLTLYAHTQLQWTELHLARLRQWAS
jgi:hypothetical protein